MKGNFSNFATLLKESDCLNYWYLKKCILIFFCKKRIFSLSLSWFVWSYGTTKKLKQALNRLNPQQRKHTNAKQEWKCLQTNNWTTIIVFIRFKNNTYLLLKQSISMRNYFCISFFLPWPTKIGFLMAIVGHKQLFITWQMENVFSLIVHHSSVWY